MYWSKSKLKVLTKALQNSVSFSPKIVIIRKNGYTDKAGEIPALFFIVRGVFSMLKRVSLLMMCLLGILLFSFSAFAKEQLQLHVEYVEGKVNDPVSKSARVAYIFHENPVFSVSTKGEVEVVAYKNTYLQDEDKGVRNRLWKKTVKDGEQFSFIPEEEFQNAEQEGSLYGLSDCYVLRIQEKGSEDYQEVFVGIVEENTFKDFQAKAKEKEARLEKKMKDLGPAAKKTA